MVIYAIGGLEPDIDRTAFVHPRATVIGNVRIGPNSSVWPQAVLRGDYGSISIGSGSNVQDGAVVHATDDLPTLVGDLVLLGHLAHLEGCTIHDRALIGVGSVVLTVKARRGSSSSLVQSAWATPGESCRPIETSEKITEKKSVVEIENSHSAIRSAVVAPS